MPGDRNQADRPKHQSTSGAPLDERPLPDTLPPNPETRAEVAYQETHTDALGSGQHAKTYVPGPSDTPSASSGETPPQTRLKPAPRRPG